ncbi:MAG TPA: undecaprenyl-phosphate glucose phosphotransferase [Thermoanaerobaculia bacterium]|nr:undecaprenyl-phosphate glucose phosphotransferase [Thermoanaerobaculia bacterium]
MRPGDIHRSNRRLAALFLICDLAATFVALAGAYWLRFEAEIIPVTKGVPPASEYFALFPFIAVLWPLVYYFHGLYQVRRNRSSVEEGFAVLVATGLASLLLIGITAFTRGFGYSRAVLALFFVSDVLLVFAGRTAIRRYLEEAWRHGYGVRRVLVVGAGRLGQAVVDKLSEHPEAGLRAVAFVDDDPDKQALAYRGVPVVGGTAEVARVVEDRRVDAVFLALPLEAHRAMLDVLKDVARTVTDVRVVPDLLQYITFRAGVEDLDGLPVVHLTQVPLTGWMSLVKRTLDLAVALTALVLLSPLFAVIALAIRLSDGRPVFYRQRRMGLDGRPFEIVKFRSMRHGAEDELGPTWAAPGDPRRTRVGQFLRRWSLDELPQLVNVVKGEMSLVGPRPERPEFVREFKEKFPQYMLRHRVRAGMTGWAQVHGWRGATDLAKRIEYDLYYIENWSLALDVKILWLTVRYGLRHRNAY